MPSQLFGDLARIKLYVIGTVVKLLLVRCYTCNLTFDIDKKKDRQEAIKHSQACHEMTQGFRA
jgi:hypothetical protein